MAMHLKLGHASPATMTKLGFLPPRAPCRVCIQSKQRKTSFRRSSRRASRILEVIHSDIVYSMIASPAGYLYVMLIVDDYSRYTWPLFLKQRSDALSAFRTWKRTWEKKLNTTVLEFHADRAGEFSSNPDGSATKFISFLEEEGVTYQLAPTETPQQNGRAESAIYGLKRIARTLLASSNLPMIFWSHAFLHATHLKNRFPHRSLPSSKTPYEFLYGSCPDYSKLRNRKDA
ncbi:MAG: transposase family protein, partial [Bacteroidota bacterium]